MKEYRNPLTVHDPLAGYIHQIEITGNERMLVLSGQVGMNMEKYIPEDVVDQLTLAFDNLISNLETADMEVQDIVKLTIYLVDPIDRELRAKIIHEKLQGYQPCMTLLFVPALGSPKLKVELDAWASRTIV